MMSKNGNTSVGNNNNSNTKKIRFNLNRSVHVTKVFVREDQRLTKNESIFTMVDTGIVNELKKINENEVDACRNFSRERW